MPSASVPLLRTWRSRVALPAVILLSLLVALGVWALTDRRVTATARLVLTTPTALDQLGTSAVSDSTFARYAKQRAVFATSDAALGAVAAQVGEPLSSLRDQVSAEASSGGAVLVISAKADSAARAVQIANAVLAVYQQQSLQQAEQRTRKVLEVIAGDRALALKQVGKDAAAQARAAAGYDSQTLAVQIVQAKFGDGVTLADRASTGNVRQPAGPWRHLLVGLVVGVALAGLLVWWWARRDHRLWTAHRAGDLIDAPLFGEVGPSTRVDLLDPFDAPAPAYRAVWAGAQERITGGTVLVTGPGRSVGRTSAALQLATAAGQDGHHVLLIDATRTRRLSECFELHDIGTGFEALVAGRVTLAKTTFQVIVGESGTAWVIPAGDQTALPLGTPRTEATARVVDELRSRFDLIIIDTEDELDSPTTTALGKSCDHVLLVLRAGTEADDVERFLRRLALHGMRPDGFVMTHAVAGRRTDRPVHHDDGDFGSPLDRITAGASAE